MCGIFAVLREPSQRAVPAANEVELPVASVRTQLESSRSLDDLRKAAAALEAVDSTLKGTPGVAALVADDTLAKRLIAHLDAVDSSVSKVEAGLDLGSVPNGASVETLNEVIVQLRDACWALRYDRIGTAQAVVEMLDGQKERSAVDAYTSIQMALSAINRLEVRGRDSAGISVVVYGHGESEDSLQQLITARRDPLFNGGAVDIHGQTVIFVYKAAAEIGALGDNVRHLRAAIKRDGLLRDLLSRPGAEAAIVSHTRWASVGTVSEPNAHPVDSQELDFSGPLVIASLNGDVDNFVELKHEHGISCAPELTSDTKIIPTMVSRRLAEGAKPLEAVRSVVDQFTGSVAIEISIADEPKRLYLAVRGSGQGCYVGFAENAFLVASEPYGLVEQCETYVRMDGETPSQISGKNGQVVELLAGGAGTMTAIRRVSYGGEELPFADSDVVTPELTTRDIDLGDAPHFLLKEISESPQSMRRTLRGKVAGAAGRLEVALPEESFPHDIRKALASGELTRVVAIGQGTASVASRALAAIIEHVAPAGISAITKPATELSGYGLRDDMSDTLVVAVSQSGTTTDTNRTVDLVRARGAKVVAIVNRRESDLTEKADGVLYTSDGRDVEMSVASTKAFYAQVVAASLLGVAIADAVGAADRRQVHNLLDALRKLPDAMGEVLTKRPELAAAARKFAPSRRSWALVGNGPNHIAAQEIRIKMSELCYKSIAFDVTEDKKHIDLSAEPLIFVCAAGVTGSMATDIAKEVAIYNAHKALPIVVCSEGEHFDAPAVVTVPKVHPAIDFVLSTMAGHLFGYEAALAIDEQASMMRSVRAVLDDVLAHDEETEDERFARLRHDIVEPARTVLVELRSGALDGHLQTSTATRLSALLRCASGLMLLESLEFELGYSVTPMSMMGELMSALSDAVDELTRPIDAVKHQAKTVTVGISRAEESFADNELVEAVIAAGVPRERLSYRSMRLLSALVPAVSSINGFTRYSVSGDVGSRTATVQVVAKGGVAEAIPSRAESDPRLTGTKHRTAYERVVTVGRGERDGRSVIIVPETKDVSTVGLLLLHVDFEERLAAHQARQVLDGYRGRYAALVDAVTETEPDFDDALLAEVSILSLLVDPVRVLAQRWRAN